MLRIFYFLLLAVILLAGCTLSSVADNNQASQASPSMVDKDDSNDSSPAKGENLSASSSSETFLGQVPKFYPEPSMPFDRQSERDFVITQELQIRIHLADKYNPGTCYGMPGPVPDKMVNSLIAENKSLADFLRDRYRLGSDLDVYEKIRQIKAIKLELIFGGKYRFNFTDGQCCFLKMYEGEVTIIGKTISDQVIKTDNEQNPC